MARRVVPIQGDQAQQIASLMGPERVTSIPAQVVDTRPGPVTAWQKTARYYKGIIALIGTILTLLTAPEIGPLQHLLPEQHQHWLTIGIGAATVVLTFLKANEHWFDGNPVTPVPSSAKGPTRGI